VRLVTLGGKSNQRNMFKLMQRRSSPYCVAKVRADTILLSVTLVDTVCKTVMSKTEVVQGMC
jgi:hypothetical protein